jgi:hypothetical protein
MRRLSATASSPGRRRETAKASDGPAWQQWTLATSVVRRSRCSRNLRGGRHRSFGMMEDLSLAGKERSDTGCSERFSSMQSDRRC